MGNNEKSGGPLAPSLLSQHSRKSGSLFHRRVLSSGAATGVSKHGTSGLPDFRTSGLLAFLLAALLLATACSDDRAKKEDPQKPPWPEQGAPDALHALAEDLLAYQGTLGRLPNDLALLDRSGLISGGPYATKGYAYHPTGIGVLKDGWRVLVADDQMRQPDRLWCVVRPPVRVSGRPGLRVVQIPLDELRAAAATAGGG